ncbi:MAG: hypothetical protein GY821_02235 [Gammaproteobacteria bacterium]|nr:hypothetical protein [Gammaproteobacteria bacterium]
MINSAKTIFVPTLGKMIPVTVGGNPSKPPLLVVSPAELFKKKNYLPKYVA